MKSIDLNKKNLRYWPGSEQLTKPLKAVAVSLNVHTNTVHRWIKSGKISYIKYGNRSIHFTYDQVQDFLANQTKIIRTQGG